LLASVRRIALHDALCNGAVVGRIFKANAAPVGTPWMWTLIFPSAGSLIVAKLERL
jgi:hypothetical protein